jgi:hypothetical protein
MSRTSIALKVKLHQQAQAPVVRKVDVTTAAAIAIVLVGAVVVVAAEDDAVQAEAMAVAAAAVVAEDDAEDSLVVHKNKGPQRCGPFCYCSPVMSRQIISGFLSYLS